MGGQRPFLLLTSMRMSAAQVAAAGLMHSKPQRWFIAPQGLLINFHVAVS